jgi:hypothetical protein
MTLKYLLLMAISHITLQRSQQAPSANSHSTNKMGRAAYDTTYICSTKDSAAEDAIAMHRAKAAEAAVST